MASRHKKTRFQTFQSFQSFKRLQEFNPSKRAFKVQGSTFEDYLN